MRKGDVIFYIPTYGDPPAWYIFTRKEGSNYWGTEDGNLYARTELSYAYSGIRYLLPKEYLE